MKRDKRQSGFTLIEAMMAVVILAVAASGISMAFAAAGATQAEAQRQILASRMAADLMEQIVSIGYDQIKIDYVGKTSSQTAENMECTGDMYNGLSCTVEECKEIPVPDGSHVVNLIQVTVTAKYKNQEITRITTLIGDKNPH
jgi:prepilin-type N-terminal cleavage/methylation domain-containing protein